MDKQDVNEPQIKSVEIEIIGNNLNKKKLKKRNKTE